MLCDHRLASSLQTLPATLHKLVRSLAPQALGDLQVFLILPGLFAALHTVAVCVFWSVLQYEIARASTEIGGWIESEFPELLAIV